MARFIEYKEYDGSANMSIDEGILDNSIKNKIEPTLRLYGWTRPTLTIGRNQSLSGINTSYCRDNNIDIIKRPTGGRAVFHHKEITYCFICPADFLKNGKSVISSYKEISEALILGFNEIEIKLTYPENKKVYTGNDYCMAISTGSDLNYNGQKLIGSAQYRKQNYILQHGSILFDIDKNILSKIFSTDDQLESHTTIKQINPQYADINILCKAIKSGFEKKFSLKFNIC